MIYLWPVLNRLDPSSRTSGEYGSSATTIPHHHLTSFDVVCVAPFDPFESESIEAVWCGAVRGGAVGGPGGRLDFINLPPIYGSVLSTRTGRGVSQKSNRFSLGAYGLRTLV